MIRLIEKCPKQFLMSTEFLQACSPPILLRNNCAFTATITVLRLMNTAPIAGVIIIPETNPVASGKVTAL